MPLIKSKESKKVNQKFQISEDVLNEVKNYCEHFKVDLDEFANQAFEFILKKDKDWTHSKKSTRGKK